MASGGFGFRFGVKGLGVLGFGGLGGRGLETFGGVGASCAESERWTLEACIQNVCMRTQEDVCFNSV